ncbi:hypothetical protein PROFUN_09486 [Planoprotostelium fungivorum]|uniref:Uncharacterized protein n=1 Tax=Planoprotostelium fungivorum TaxID=1890364 RepID=A0A2P6NH54_9EUKA|nr:hypothetical protein PROFUN_09486 [Planoprotostelium fungivorum]
MAEVSVDTITSQDNNDRSDTTCDRHGKEERDREKKFFIPKATATRGEEISLTGTIESPTTKTGVLQKNAHLNRQRRQPLSPPHHQKEIRLQRHHQSEWGHLRQANLHHLDALTRRSYLPAGYQTVHTKPLSPQRHHWQSALYILNYEILHKSRGDHNRETDPKVWLSYEHHIAKKGISPQSKDSHLFGHPTAAS